jgi:Mn-dependent DtxR family transcriptional regulator
MLASPPSSNKLQEIIKITKRRQIMEQTEATAKIIEGLGKEKGKTNFYFSELANILGQRPKVAKKLISKMIEDQILEYWCSDNMSLFRLKRVGKQL